MGQALNLVVCFFQARTFEREHSPKPKHQGMRVFLAGICKRLSTKCQFLEQEWDAENKLAKH